MIAGAIILTAVVVFGAITVMAREKECEPLATVCIYILVSFSVLAAVVGVVLVWLKALHVIP